MPFGIIGRMGPGMRQVVGFEDRPREGVLLEANLGRAIASNWDFTAYVCDSAATRPSSQITLGRLVIIVTIIISNMQIKVARCCLTLQESIVTHLHL